MKLYSHSPPACHYSHRRKETGSSVRMLFIGFPSTFNTTQHAFPSLFLSQCHSWACSLGHQFSYYKGSVCLLKLPSPLTFKELCFILHLHSTHINTKTATKHRHKCYSNNALDLYNSCMLHRELVQVSLYGVSRTILIRSHSADSVFVHPVH